MATDFRGVYYKLPKERRDRIEKKVQEDLKRLDKYNSVCVTEHVICPVCYWCVDCGDCDCEL